MIAEKLRKAVLQAAIQGKLTQQLPEDGDARDLLKDIQKEKARLIKAGKLKPEKPLPVITEDEIPFDIPENWCWVRLGQLSYFINGDRGKNYAGKSTWQESGVPFINAGSLNNSFLTEQNVNFVSENVFNKLRSGFIQLGDLLYCLRGSLGKFSINNLYSRGSIGSSIVIIRPIDSVLTNFIGAYLLSPLAGEMIQVHSNGTAQPNLSAEGVKSFLIPLPPIPEQKRLLTLLRDYLDEVDGLTIDESKLEALQRAFPQQLKNAILQAAIQGKLTDQRPEDGDARDLLKEIQQEKAKLVKAGKIKKTPPLPPITEDEIPFDIPENWVWCRLGDIVSYRMGKTPPRGEPIYWGEGYPWVSIADINDGGITERTKESITLKAKELIFKGIVSPKGSMIMSFKLSIGKTSILGIDSFHNEAIITIDPVLYADGLKSYLLRTLKYFSSYGDSKDAMKGKTLNSKSISEMLISLPPLVEQKRIVDRLDQLLPELKKLEADESKLTLI